MKIFLGTYGTPRNLWHSHTHTPSEALVLHFVYVVPSETHVYIGTF